MQVTKYSKTINSYGGDLTKAYNVYYCNKLKLRSSFSLIGTFRDIMKVKEEIYKLQMQGKIFFTMWSLEEIEEVFAMTPSELNDIYENVFVEEVSVETL